MCKHYIEILINLRIKGQKVHIQVRDQRNGVQVLLENEKAFVIPVKTVIT